MNKYRKIINTRNEHKKLVQQKQKRKSTCS